MRLQLILEKPITTSKLVIFRRLLRSFFITFMNTVCCRRLSPTFSNNLYNYFVLISIYIYILVFHVYELFRFSSLEIASNLKLSILGSNCLKVRKLNFRLYLSIHFACNIDVYTYNNCI